MLPVTSLYAGLLALLLVTLSVKTIMMRRKTGTSVGDQGKPDMLKAIRVQGNFTEYTPFALLLLALSELQGAPGWALHVLGLMLLVGRLLHVRGFGATPQIIPLRQAGMVLTFSMIIIAGLGLVAHSLL